MTQSEGMQDAADTERRLGKDGLRMSIGTGVATHNGQRGTKQIEVRDSACLDDGGGDGRGWKFTVRRAFAAPLLLHYANAITSAAMRIQVEIMMMGLKGSGGPRLHFSPNSGGSGSRDTKHV